MYWGCFLNKIKNSSLLGIQQINIILTKYIMFSLMKNKHLSDILLFSCYPFWRHQNHSLKFKISHYSVDYSKREIKSKALFQKHWFITSPINFMNAKSTDSVKILRGKHFKTKSAKVVHIFLWLLNFCIEVPVVFLVLSYSRLSLHIFFLFWRIMILLLYILLKFILHK